MKYSIIYAVIRPEIAERVSLGLDFGLATSGKINTIEDINYLTRYSNNLIAVSPLQSIDIDSTEQCKANLFRNYIHEVA